MARRTIAAQLFLDGSTRLGPFTLQNNAGFCEVLIDRAGINLLPSTAWITVALRYVDGAEIGSCGFFGGGTLPTSGFRIDAAVQLRRASVEVVVTTTHAFTAGATVTD